MINFGNGFQITSAGYSQQEIKCFIISNFGPYFSTWRGEGNDYDYLVR